MKKLLFLLVLIPALLIVAFIFPDSAGLTFLERKAPQAAFSKDSVEEMSLLITSSDKESGLSELIITAEQNGASIELLKKTFEPSATEDVSKFSYSKLKEGPAKIKAVISDSSLWKNSTESSVDVLVDFSPPRVRLLSLQHVAAQGGTEFVIYTVEDTNLASHGVKVGDIFFPGFKIEEAGTVVNPLPNTFGGLFALPLGYKSAGAPSEIVAKDQAGNITKVAVQFRMEPKPQAEVTMQLKDAFLSAKTGELFPGYLRMVSDEEKEKNKFNNDIPEMLWKFRLINRNYRDLLDAELEKIFNNSKLPRQWKDTFIKPMSSATSSTFGEKRTYKYGDLDGGYSVHNGLDLASVNNDKVQAANDGVVVLAKDFGIYGNAVVIDHGMGLFTLYGHLSSFGVKLNDKVSRGQEIGRSGQTGLAGGDHLHFEFRLRNIPVTPIEWWDSKWIKDNIDGKIAELAQAG